MSYKCIISTFLFLPGKVEPPMAACNVALWKWKTSICENTIRAVSPDKNVDQYTVYWCFRPALCVIFPFCNQCFFCILLPTLPCTPRSSHQSPPTEMCRLCCRVHQICFVWQQVWPFAPRVSNQNASSADQSKQDAQMVLAFAESLLSFSLSVISFILCTFFFVWKG